MDLGKFRAVSIAVRNQGSRSSLVEAFNSWADKTRPSAIIHVHYFHDASSHIRGYQVVYQELSSASDAPAATKGNGHHDNVVPEAQA